MPETSGLKIELNIPLFRKIKSFLENADIEKTPVINIQKDAFQNHKRKAISFQMRVDVWELIYPNAFNGICKLCEKNKIFLKESGTWEVSHIKPFSKGGDEILENLRPLCRFCNRSMGYKTLQEYCFSKYGKEKANEILENLKIFVK